MKLLSAVMSTLLFAGIAFTATAEGTVKITDISKPAKQSTVKVGTLRSAPYKLSVFPDMFKGKPCVIAPRGKGAKPGITFSFNIDKPATIYLFVHKRGNYAPKGWEKTDMKATWLVGKAKYPDLIFKKDFPAGKVDIPTHTGKQGSNYGVPHMAVIVVK